MTWPPPGPVRLLAGAGQAAALHQHLPDGPLLLLTSPGMLRRGTASRLLAHSPPSRPWTVRAVAPNPDLDALDALAESLRSQAPVAGALAGIVALGGGSVIDAAKLLSVLLPRPGVARLHHALREGQALDFGQPLPLVCLPTTAGTGAEVTPQATVWDGVRQCPHTLSHAALLPQLAILDPELTTALPWPQTLYSALDATAHGLETLWNRQATADTAAGALQALRWVVDHLPRVQRNPADLEARAQLQAAGWMAGLAAAQHHNALAHALSYPLTARHRVPHGLASSFTLAALMQWVQQQQAWAVAPPDDLQQALLDLLDRQGLAQQVLRHCSAAQVAALLDRMAGPAQACQFVLPVGRDELQQILHHSLQAPAAVQAASSG